MKYFSSFVLVLLFTCTIFAQPENCPTGMTHYYKFDETAGPPYVDSYGINDAVADFPPFAVDGIVNSGQDFLGSVEEVNIPDDDSFDWGIDESFSIEYWILSNSTQSGNRVAIGRDYRYPEVHWWSGIWDTGLPSFILFDSIGTQGVLTGTTPIRDNFWHHIVCVRNADNDSIYLYVDGVVEDAQEVIYQAGFNAPNTPINIGYLDLFTKFHIDATIDEVALYSKALSSGEIEFHHSEGLEGRGYCDGETTEYTLLANSYIVLYGQRNSVGDIHSNGNIIYPSNRKWSIGYHTGNLSALGKIKVDKRNTIEGDAIAGDKIKIHKSSAITGSVVEETNVDPLPIDEPTYSADGENITVPFNNTRELDPGSYGKVKVRWFAKLKLSAGDYYFKSLTTYMFTEIIADVTDGPVNIYIVKDLKISSLSKVDIVPTGESGTEDLSITILKKADIGNFTRVLGSINAPKSHVRLGKYSRFKGSIVAKKITIKHGTQFLPHGHEAPLAKQPTQEEVNGEEGAGEIVDYKLDQNYPNPFNPTTTIGFTIPEPGNVTLTVYNLLGQNVATLVDEGLGSGYHSVVFNAKDLTSGIYIYRVVSANYSATKKMQLIK